LTTITNHAKITTVDKIEYNITSSDGEVEARCLRVNSGRPEVCELS